MQVRQQKYAKSFYLSLLFHIIMLTALIANFDFSSPMPVVQNSNQKADIINAMVVNDTLPLTKKILPKPPKPVVAAAQPEKPKEQQKPEPVVVKEKTIIIPDKKQKKLVQEKLAKQLLADMKKQMEQEKKEKHKDLTKAFEKDMKEMAKKSLQQQMLKEQQRLAGARSQQMQGEVNKYKALILQAISQNWLIPGNVNKKLSAELLIRVAPGGVVLDVQLIKSSGDEMLDRSARAAILKSSPLPVPADADAFEPFRQFVLKVKPENILASENWIS